MMSVRNSLHSLIDWLQDRMRERTSWDGLTLIVVSVLALVAAPLIRYVAWFGIAYGIWTLWTKERNRSSP
jgi:hypothetical protein